MKKQRKIVQAAPGAGVRQQTGSPGGGVEPIDFGSNMFAERGGPGPKETAEQVSGGLLQGITDYFYPEAAEERENRKLTLDHDACIKSGARDYRYMPEKGKNGAAEIITSSHQNGTTLDHFSASRKFLADRDRFGSERSAWKHSLNTDANTGGSYGLMGDANFETSGAKYAVTVANSDYKHLDDLSGAKLDAGAMSGYYSGLGFTTLDFENANASAMSTFFNTGANIARPGDHVVLYFAGHGNGQGALGVNADGAGKDVMAWGTMVSIANKAVAAGFKATIVMDACQSDSLQLEAMDYHEDVNDKVVLSEAMKMNVQSESGAEEWASMKAQLERMNITIEDMDQADYQYLMEKRHGLRHYKTGKPLVDTE